MHNLIKSLFLVCLFTLPGCGGGGGSSSSPAALGGELLGGDTTVFNTTGEAFSLPATNLTFEQEGDFKIGNSFFTQDWVTAPSTTTARDGLGPLFNANSCASCHTNDGRAAPPETENEDGSGTAIEAVAGLLMRLSIEVETETGAPQPDPVYGGQFNHNSILGVDGEGTLSIHYEEITGRYADGTVYTLLNPTYTLTDLNYGDPDSGLMMSPRIAPQVIGMGLLESISESDILALADPDDANGDGISGRVNRVWSESLEQIALGRFGWKAGKASVVDQVAGAFAGDIGITSTLFPNESCTEFQIDCLDSISGGDPEISDDIFDFVVFYTQAIGVPAQRNSDDATVREGGQLFLSSGCASCHTPTFQTASDHEVQALHQQTIHPYTDLLLHDMGEGLADLRPDFEATGQEWRTPPLWGIGLIETVNGHTRYLHDGRARNLEEAILWHGGEAESAKQNFTNLTAVEREALLTFLKSL